MAYLTQLKEALEKAHEARKALRACSMKRVAFALDHSSMNHLERAEEEVNHLCDSLVKVIIKEEAKEKL
jgi:hypothetical protein